MPYCDEPEEAAAECAARPTRGNARARADGEARAPIESRLGLLIDGVVDFAIFLLDPDGIITNWNAGAERIKGYSADEIVGQHFSRFYTGEDRAADLPRRVLEAAARDGRYEAEGWRVRKDGSHFWANVVIDPIRDKETGELLGFAKITRDITERRDAAIALRRAQEQLAQAQKMEGIGQLTSGVAHDFNNLLAVIQGNLETVQRMLQSAEANPARMRRAVGNAMRGVERAAALTQRLLAFSRRQPLDPKVVDANDLVRGMTDLLRRTLGERIAIHTTFAGDLWLTRVDPNQLETALLNLAVNARDAMPGGGRLTIETINAIVDADGTASQHAQAASGEHAVISVSDSGCGMKREVLQRAFEPFFTTKESGHGTGLGLAQVYGFVKQSGGHIRIRSEPGRGPRSSSAFRAYGPTPLRSAPTRRLPRPRAGLSRQSWWSRTIPTEGYRLKHFPIWLTNLRHGRRSGSALVSCVCRISLRKAGIHFSGKCFKASLHPHRSARWRRRSRAAVTRSLRRPGNSRA